MHVIEHPDLDERSRSLEVSSKARLWVAAAESFVRVSCEEIVLINVTE